MSSTGDPEDLGTIPNPSILLSRPDSSGSELSDLPSEPGATRTGNGSTMAHNFGDVGELAAVGLVATAVDQEVLEQEVAVKVLFFPPTLPESVNGKIIILTVLDRQRKPS